MTENNLHTAKPELGISDPERTAINFTPELSSRFIPEVTEGFINQQLSYSPALSARFAEKGRNEKKIYETAQNLLPKGSAAVSYVEASSQNGTEEGVAVAMQKSDKGKDGQPEYAAFVVPKSKIFWEDDSKRVGTNIISSDWYCKAVKSCLRKIGITTFLDGEKDYIEAVLRLT